VDLTKCYWEAVHTTKTVRHPDYVDIRRDTLQSIKLFFNTLTGQKDIVTLTRPDSIDKWLISFRMRTQVDGNSGVVKQRFWIFNDRSKKEITRVHEDGKIDKVKDWSELKINPATITRIDEL